MKISPLDIRNQTFRTVFRGADSEEVRTFLDLVAIEYESLLQENGNLADRLRHAEDRLEEYREMDATLRSSLLTAERLTAEARESSKREAGLLIQEAEWRAKQMLDDARERLSRLTEEIRQLQAKKDAYAQHMRSFLEAQLDLLGRGDEYLEGVDRLAEEASMLSARARRGEPRPAVPSPGVAPGTSGVSAAPGAAASAASGPGAPAASASAASAPAHPGGNVYENGGAERAPSSRGGAAPVPPSREGYPSRPSASPAGTVGPSGRGLSRDTRPDPRIVPPPDANRAARGAAPAPGQVPAPAPAAPAPAPRAPAPAPLPYDEDDSERAEGFFELSAEEDEHPRP